MERKVPVLSYIVPVYKVEKYIHLCVDSILSQTIQDFELILIDDGSPDNCPTILDEYAKKDNRIKVIHQKNSGVSVARNTGIKTAIGKWLYFVDSDDWLIATSMNQLIDTAERTNADIVFTDCLEQYEDGTNRRVKLYSQQFISDDREFISSIQKSILCHKYSPYFSAAADNAYPAPWSKLFKASLIKDNDIWYNPLVKGVYDDGLFTIEALEFATKIVYEQNCTYNYRILESSIVHIFKQDMVSRFELNCVAMDDYINKYRKDEDFIQAEYCRRIAYFSSFMSSYFFHEKNEQSKKEKINDLKHTIKRSPWKEAVEKAQYKNLEKKHMYTLFCMRTGLFEGLNLYSSMKRILKNQKTG